MALKDWKKVSANGWRNNITKKALVIYQTKESYAGDKSNKYNLTHDNKFIKKNVSRATALKYAKAYMRTH